MAKLGSTLSALPVRRAGRLLAVLAVALAAGHLAQTLASKKAAPPALSALKSPVNVVQLSAAPEKAGLTAAVLAPSAGHGVPPTQGNPTPSVVSACTPTLHLAAVPGAMVAVRLTAPCDAGARVELHHAGLTLTERVAANGQMTARLPMLDQTGTLEIRFADGRTLAATRFVPELAGLRRFAVVWSGAQAFVVHGLENGAEFGKTGDVSPSQPGIIPTGVSVGGWLSVLGDATVENPKLAQIYTYPLDHSADVVVELPVTSANCGRAVNGQAISSADGLALATDLTLAMPECSAVGDVLVLNNLAQTTKVAAR